MQGDDIHKTTNILYSAQCNSIDQVIAAKPNYLTDKLKLNKGIDFNVPSSETVMLAFLQSHESRALAAKFSGVLNIKLATQKKKTLVQSTPIPIKLHNRRSFAVSKSHKSVTIPKMINRIVRCCSNATFRL